MLNLETSSDHSEVSKSRSGSQMSAFADDEDDDIDEEERNEGLTFVKKLL